MLLGKTLSCFAVCTLAIGVLSCSDPTSNDTVPKELSNQFILFTGRVANSDDNNAIHAILPNGSGLRLVTRGLWWAADPRWSPDGSRFAYVTQSGPITTWVMRTDQSESRQIAANLCGGPPFVGMTWSPTGDRIIGDCNSPPHPPHQYVINVADATYYSLDQRWGRNATGADWSPIGDRILYVVSPAGLSGPRDVHVANLDGSGDALVVSNARAPKWSPDGSQIAFIRNAGSSTTSTAVFLANADGSGVRQLTFPPATLSDINPTWSPDGMWLAFSRGRAIAVIKVDGSGNRIVTPDSLEAGRPDW